GDGTATAANAGFDLDAVEAIASEPGVYLAMFGYEVDDSNGNNNGKIDPGETVDLIVTLKNNGDLTASNTEGVISTGSIYMTIDNGTASFGNLTQGQTGEGTFTVTANEATPSGEPVEIGLDVSANGGSYSNNYSMNFVVGQIPVLILDLDPNHNSGTAMQEAIQQIELAADYETSIPNDLNVYSSIFLCLGIYSSNHQLTSTEGQSLADFLNNGGNLYMEGGDTWYFDDQTAVHAMFNINGTSDGSGDLSTIQGVTGAFAEGMLFNYSGENNWIDQIEPLGSAFVIFNNQSPAYATGIAYDGGSYKTIGASHEFGGLDDGGSPSTKAELMAAYLDFFGLTATLQANFNSNVTEICESESVEFYDNSAGDIISWEWTFEGGNPESSTVQNPVVMYESSGEFDVSLTVSDGTNSSTIELPEYITVGASPDTPGLPAGLTEICTNEAGNTEYEINAIGNADSYIWTVDPSEAGEINGSGTTGTFTWSVMWEGTATISVKSVNACGESEFSNGIEVSCSVCTGVQIELTENINLFPNPGNGRFILQLNSHHDEAFELEVLDLSGNLVYKDQLASVDGRTSFELNLSGIGSGVFFLVLRNQNFFLEKKLIIK
ncbi:MAG: T9SS type A sorting domain-containing protein, partial [Bacteroidales bacterium]|nr:T9SS type A sorting domain-containing protein [Bacteroidales bacterium]